MGSIFLISSFFSFLGRCQNGLEEELRSEHFIIYYDKEVEQFYVYKIRDMCENLYRRITQEFNLIREEPWLWENRAKIYIAKDKNDFLAKFGCPSWSGACVNYRTKTIFTYSHQQRFDVIFIHELTHIIFREYIGKEKLPLWLNEGVAMYMENKYKESYQADLSYLKKIIKKNRYIPFKELIQLNYFSLNSRPKEYINIFYLQSFSIIYFLLKRYGREYFSNFLFFLKNDYDFEEALAKVFFSFPSIEKLEEAWKKYFLE
jgi:hypothetical protein